MKNKRRFPECPYCHHIFAYKTGYYTIEKGYVNLQDEWSMAHSYSGKHMRELDCPMCGKRIKVGYECVMYSHSEKVVSE